MTFFSFLVLFMKLYQLIKYQYTNKGQLLTSSAPAVLKLDLDTSILSICSLDMLKVMETVKLHQSPTFVSRLGVLACKYNELGNIKKFQVHVSSKRDLDEIRLKLKDFFGLNWRSKDAILGKTQDSANTQQMLEYTQTQKSYSIPPFMEDCDFANNKMLENTPKTQSKHSNTQTETEETSFTLTDLHTLLKNPIYRDFVNDLGNEFTVQYYACQ